MGARRAEPDGRIKAFEAFHREIGTDAARYAATILGPRRLDLLEDVLQESWARAWRAWDNADPDRRVAWFFRILRNSCIDQHRQHRPTEPLPPGLQAPGDIENSTIARVDSDRTFALLGSLPAPLRETLWLREVRDLTYAEIAELQGVPVGTVMSRLHAARKKASRILRSSS